MIGEVKGSVRSRAGDPVSRVGVERQEPGVHQHEPIDALGMVGGEPSGHQAAHRMAHDVGALDAQLA